MSQLGNPVLRKVASGLHRTIAFTLFGATVIGSGALLVTFGQSMAKFQEHKRISEAYAMQLEQEKLAAENSGAPLVNPLDK